MALEDAGGRVPWHSMCGAGEFHHAFPPFQSCSQYTRSAPGGEGALGPFGHGSSGPGFFLTLTISALGAVVLPGIQVTILEKDTETQRDCLGANLAHESV
jgi:hypothetical protein